MRSASLQVRLGQLRRLRLAKDAMDRDWAEPIDLDAIAAHAGYSRFHFVRLFSEAYGQTPGQYLTRRRIERAEELLRTADLSITEICMLVGFTSLGSFSAGFRKHTGSTPSEYRARYLRPGAALVPGCYALLWHGGFKGLAKAAGDDGGCGHDGGCGDRGPGEARNSGEAGRVAAN